MSGACLRPADGEHRVGAFAIEGWVHLEGAAVDRISVRADGEHLAWARPYAAYRSEAEGIGTYPGICGFDHLVRAGTLAVGAHDLEFEVHTGGSTVTLDGPTIVIDPAGEPDVPTGLDHVRQVTDRAIERVRNRSHDHGRRVLVVGHSAALGGAQLYFQQIIEGLLDDGIEVVAALPDWGPMADELRSRDVDVHVVVRHAVAAHEYEGYIAQLARLAADEDVDAVVVNTLVMHPAADMAVRAGLPVVWFVQESATLEEFHVRVFGEGVLSDHAAAGARAALGRANAVVFAADATADLFVADVPDERRLWAPSGIPLEPFRAYRDRTDRAALRAGIGIAADEVVLLCSGVFDARKGQAALVEAADRLRDHPRPWRLVLMGAVVNGHEYSARVRELVIRRELESRVTILPVIADTMPWYLASDALVSASDLESYPRSIIEAMALDSAVLSTDVFGVPDMVTDGETGLLFPPRDVAALTETIDRYLRLGDDERVALATRASEVAFERFTTTPMREAFTRLVGGLLADPDADPATIVSPGRRHR